MYNKLIELDEFINYTKSMNGFGTVTEDVLCTSKYTIYQLPRSI